MALYWAIMGVSVSALGEASFIDVLLSSFIRLR
jgi:hypothetical protein